MFKLSVFFFIYSTSCQCQQVWTQHGLPSKVRFLFSKSSASKNKLRHRVLHVFVLFGCSNDFSTHESEPITNNQLNCLLFFTLEMKNSKSFDEKTSNKSKGHDAPVETTFVFGQNMKERVKVWLFLKFLIVVFCKYFKILRYMRVYCWQVDRRSSKDNCPPSKNSGETNYFLQYITSRYCSLNVYPVWKRFSRSSQAETCNSSWHEYCFS